jgi:transcriptional regulator with XRE-family HTH domain
MARANESAGTYVAKLLDRGMKGRGFDDQSKIAELCAVDPSYLSKLKSGRIKNPSERVLECLAKVLGQTAGQYRTAILADRGELPDWVSWIEIENGVRLTTADERFLDQAVMMIVEARRRDGEAEVR